ncbi:hypothetical protein PanWU01x14_231420 [Parasponia andersonii]|uniref:DUF4220 domain-containing protein n=1 Tax=Parasponia andersonii TaxID=3476 RepID=A0A2P5BKE4_PARAD|nr:hypothetical protein PanWU01x14_231420 [Parasponia andersonii]
MAQKNRSIPWGLCPCTPNEFSGGLRDLAYRPDPSASTTSIKISPNYKNVIYVTPRSFRAKGEIEFGLRTLTLGDTYMHGTTNPKEGTEDMECMAPPGAYNLKPFSSRLSWCCLRHTDKGLKAHSYSSLSGGLDSITSYALEDNEFWLRHFIGLVLQATVTAYSIYLTLPTNKLWLPTILMFLVGIFKYGERTYTFYLASSDCFGAANATNSLLRSSSNQNLSTEARMTTVPDTAGTSDQAQQTTSEMMANPLEVISLPNLKDLNDLELLEVAYKLFGRFKGLIVGRSLSSEVRTSSRKAYLEADHTSACKVIEHELSILYEVLHTKVVVARRRIGFVFRFICFCFILGASLFFLLSKKPSDLDEFDIKVTYSLLIGAIVLDFISFVQLISSDWNLGALNSTWRRYIPSIVVKNGRWSESMFQGTVDAIKIALFSSSEKVTEDLKALLFDSLKTKSGDADDKDDVIAECLWRGHATLSSSNYRKLQWSVKEFQYSDSLLLWHLATELCYHKEIKDKSINSETKRIGKLVSDYLFCLLVTQPSMLSPVLGNWNVVFQDTYAEAKRFIDKYKISSRDDHLKVCEKLVSVEIKTDELAADMKGSKSKSVLFDACFLAQELQKLEDLQWDVMDRMWVELMSYAAINSLPSVHAQQPSKGGELWTFTWLLMNHLGLGFQFEIQQEAEVTTDDDK